MRRSEIHERLKSPLISGLMHCHHKGLHSVVLEEWQDGSVSRIFFTTDESTMDALFRLDGHMTIGAHNHDKPIAFTVLFGDVWHLNLMPDAGGQTWYRYPFQSAIDSGKFGISQGEPVNVRVSITRLDCTAMDTLSIHTVIACQRAAWHCDEFPKDGREKYVWSPRPGLEISSEGLYIPMEQGTLESARLYLLEAMTSSGVN